MKIEIAVIVLVEHGNAARNRGGIVLAGRLRLCRVKLRGWILRVLAAAASRHTRVTTAPGVYADFAYSRLM